MGIPEEEPNLETYYKLIEQGADLYHEKIEELAEGIFKQLMGLDALNFPQCVDQCF